MKKLNLNNTIAKMMMQRRNKKNEYWFLRVAGFVFVKNQIICRNYNINFLRLLVIAFFICIFGGVETLWGKVDSGDKPYYNSGDKTWYSLYYWDEEKSASSTELVSDKVLFTHTVFAPCQNTVHYYAQNGNFWGSPGIAYLDIYSSDNGSNYTKFVSEKYFNNKNYTEYNSSGVPQEITHIRFTRHGKAGSTLAFNLKNFRIELAPHIRFDNGTSTGAKDYTPADMPSTNMYETATQDYHLRSFLTSNTSNNQTITISRVSGSLDFNATFKNGLTTVTPGQNACGVWNGGATDLKNTNDNAYIVSISFTPTTSGRQTATFKLSDGTNDCSATITVSATGLRIDPDFTWDSKLNNQTFVFTSHDLSNTASSKDTRGTKGKVSYSIEASDGNSLSGNTLNINYCSAIKVKATITQTDQYNAKTIDYTFTPDRVTPVITFAELTKGNVGTQYDLSEKANWAATSGQPARNAWVNDDGVVINYTSSNHAIAADGATFTPQKAGSVTITASIAAANNHYASSNNPEQSLQIDFKPNVIIHTFPNPVKVGSETTEVINLADFFVPNGSYSATVTSGSEFSVINGTNISDNKITVKFAPTSISDETASSDVKEATIKINDGKEYLFNIQATAEKAEADLYVSRSGDTHVFSEITLSNRKSTTADVTYKINGVAISGNTYKIPSVSPITISATTPANAGYMAGYAVLEPFTPEKVTPVLSWNQSDFGDKKVGDADLTFNAATWTNTQGEPDASKWAENEVTIKYTPINDAITINGNTIHINKAGVATLTASIEGEKNHLASNTISKTINIAFADGKTITLNGSDGTGTFVGESSQLNVDLSTEMVKEGDLVPTSTNQYFSVTFNGYAMNITFTPTIYNNGNITETFTFLDNGTGKEYTLLLSGKTKKHIPVIAWKDDKTLALSANPEMKSLNELLKNCSYCDGATIKTSDATVVMVFKSDETPAGEGEGGTLFWARGNGPAIITIEIPETESHTSATSQETFTVTGIEDTRIEWSQSLYFDTDEPDVKLTAVAYPLYGNTPTNQTITYQLISNDDNAVSLLQGTDGKWYLAMNNVGTATIKAIASASSNYNSSESPVRTITINEPAQTGECIITFDDVTESARTYNFVLDGHDDNDYYYVDKIAYHYYVKGDTKFLWSGGDDRTIKATVKDINNSTLTYSKEYTASAAHAVSGGGEEKNDNESIPINNGDLLKSIEFSGDIGTNNSAFTNIVVTPSKYLKATSTTSHTFGNPTAIFVGQSETVQLTIAEYAFLNGNQVDMKLVNLNDDGDYIGGEFTILDKSGDDDWGVPCDYGKIKVHVQFAPLSGKDNAVHKCRIKMTGTIGTNTTQPIYFTLEGHAQRNQQEVVWEQDLDNWNSQTGEVILAALSNQSDAQGAMEYEIVSQTAATSKETTGVVTKEGSKLIIHKAGTVTIKAKHPGDDKYLPAELERTFTISRVDPTISLSHDETEIAESSQINVTLGEAPYTITGSAKYGNNVITGYATGTGEKIDLSSNTTGVVSIQNDNKLKFNSADVATITASIAEDDIVNTASFTFTVNVKPSEQVVTITNDLTNKLVTTDTENGITLTATAVNALDGTMKSDGTITYEITEGDEYAYIAGDKLVSKKNGVGNITVVAHSSHTNNYKAATSEPVTFSMEKATPTITWTTAPGATMTFTDRMRIEAITDNDDEGAEIMYEISSAGGTAAPQTIEGITTIVPATVGKIKVTPNIEKTKNYNQFTAIDIAKYVEITNGMVTFTIADISMHYGDPEQTITPQTGGLKYDNAKYMIESGDYQYIVNTNGEIVDGKIKAVKAHPAQPITVTPTFTLANYTISCNPFTVTIDKAEQSLTWDPTTQDISATQIGTTTKIKAPKIGYKHSGIESDIKYTYNSEYMTISAISGNTDEINVNFLKYTSDILTVSASYTETENVSGATTETPLSIALTLQPQKVIWNGETPTISNIYTTESTDKILSTLKAVTRTTYDQPNNNVARYRYETSNNCPSEATLITLEDNGDGSCNVKYNGDGSGHVKIIAFAETANGYQATNPEQEQTIEFNILPAPAKVDWNTDEFADARYGDLIEMTPSVTPDKGDKSFSYTFEEDMELTCQGNVLSIKDVATEGTTITAWNTKDCFLAADEDGHTRSVTINKAPQEIVWIQGDMTLNVIGSENVQLTAYAIDSRHKDQSTTCLELTDSKYITAKTSGDNSVNASETDMTITYDVKEQSGVCKVGDELIVTVDVNGLLHVTGNGTGSVKITPTVSEGAHYTTATGTPIIVTVQKVTPTITVTNTPADVHFGDAAWTTLAATAQVGGNDVYTDYYMLGSEGHIILSSSDEDVVSITNNKYLQFNKAGQATITAKIQDADCRMNDASTTFDVTVQTTDQTINYTTIDDVNTGQYANPIVIDLNSHFEAYDENLSKATGGTIVYEVTITPDEGCSGITFDNQHTITIDGTGSGSVSIKATQDGTDASGNMNYNSTEITKSFNVNKITPAVTLDAITGTIQFGDEIALHATASGTDYADDSNNNGTKIRFKYNGKAIEDNTFTVDDADGKFTVQAYMDADCQINSTASSEAGYSIALTAQEIVWTQSEMASSYTTLNNNQFTLDAYAIDAVHKTTEIKTGATIDYELVLTPDDSNCDAIATLSNGVLTLTGAGSGTVTVKATCQDVTGKYSPVTTPMEKTLTITKVVPKFNWTVAGDMNATYGNNDVTATATHDGTGTVTYGSSEQTVATIDGNGNITIVGAGTTTISATLAADCKYEAVTTAITKTLTVGQATGTINWVTGKEPHDDTYSTTLTEEVTAISNNVDDESIDYSSSNTDVADFENGVLKIKKAGTTTITATRAATKNFTAASCSTTITISKATCTITVTAPQNITFGQTEALQYSTTNTDENLQVTFTSGNTSIVSISGDQATGAGAGKTYVYAEIAESDNYLSAKSDDFNITVTQASKTFTIADMSLTYGDQNEPITITDGGITDYTVSFNINDGDKSYISINSDNTIDAIGAKYDDNGNLVNIPVTAKFTSSNYEIADVTFNVTVAKADQTITWDENKDYNVSNMIGSIDLSDYCTLTVGGGNISFTSSNNDIAEVSGNNLTIKQITSEGSVTITARVDGNDNYEASSETRTFTITIEPLKITINGGSSDPIDLGTTDPIVTSVTNDVDFATLRKDNNAIISCNYNNVTYTFISSNETIAKFDNEGKIIAYKKSDEGLNVTVTAHVDGLSDKQATMSIKIPRGTMVFQNPGNWDDNNNWLRTDILPLAEDHNVSIGANCTVNVTTAECWDMEIADNGMLTISTDGILNVAHTLSNSDASKLVIAADADGQGTLIFHNSTDTDMPQATVEMWCKGSKAGTGTNGKDINPNWQYRGIAVSSATLTENAPGLIYQWSEAAKESDAGTGITEQWTKVTDNQMSAWNGYAVAKYTDGGADYKTSAAGALTNDDKVINLAYTADQNSEGVKSGFNLITNSFTAPLNYSKLVYNDGIENGVVLFNTGSYVDWKNPDKQILSDGNAPGQYIFLPKNTGPEIASDVIPSGESFFVVVTDANAANKSITIPYAAVEQQTSGALKMPERREVYGKLIIEVDGGEGADHLYLLENENRIRGFENGYDGPKYAGTKGNPMLYATTDDERMCVSADSSLLGQYIGFAAGKHDVTYTMTFDASALSGYSELYLYDTREKRYTNILDGGTYTFKGLVSGEDRRFKIVGSREDGKSVTGDDQTIIVTGNRFHVTGYDNADERIYLVDMTGKILWETSTAFGPWFDIPTDIPAGVYVIKTGNHTAKMAVK